MQTEKDVLVDIGCGDGELLLRVAAVTGCTTYGFDISDTLIRHAAAAAGAEGALLVACRPLCLRLRPFFHRLHSSRLRLNFPAARSTATSKASERALSARCHFVRASFLDPAFALPEGATAVYLYLLDEALVKLRGLLQAR